MRDLIVKINMDQHSVASDQVLINNQLAGNLDDPSVRSLKEDQLASESDGSDSGTAGTLSSQSFWPDLEVLDPDHPM